MSVKLRRSSPTAVPVLNSALTVNYSPLTVAGKGTKSLLGQCEDYHMVDSPLQKYQAESFGKKFTLKFFGSESLPYRMAYTVRIFTVSICLQPVPCGSFLNVLQISVFMSISL